MNKNTKSLMLSAGATYGLLKLPMAKVDPYTRASIGMLIGFGTLLYGIATDNQLFKYSGFGIALGGFVTLEEILHLGGKIVSNEYSKPVYALHETEGVRELQPFEIPDYRVDGLTIKGMNGVFKAHDGVYLKILADGTIKPTFGAGALVNKIGAGYMNENWAKNIGDDRWVRLFEKSV